MENTKTTPDPIIERMKQILGPEWHTFSSDELVIAHMIAAEQLKDESTSQNIPKE